MRTRCAPSGTTMPRRAMSTRWMVDGRVVHPCFPAGVVRFGSDQQSGAATAHREFDRVRLVIEDLYFVGAGRSGRQRDRRFRQRRLPKVDLAAVDDGARIRQRGTARTWCTTKNRGMTVRFSNSSLPGRLATCRKRGTARRRSTGLRSGKDVAGVQQVEHRRLELFQRVVPAPAARRRGETAEAG